MSGPRQGPFGLAWGLDLLRSTGISYLMFWLFQELHLVGGGGYPIFKINKEFKDFQEV